MKVAPAADTECKNVSEHETESDVVVFPLEPPVKLNVEEDVKEEDDQREEQTRQEEP